MDEWYDEIGWVVEHHETLPSTSDEARARGDDAPHGLIVMADQQTGGRGRGGNTWTSPPGGLYASIVLRRVPAEAARFLPLIAAGAVIEGIEDLGPRDRLWLKWPNDILIGPLEQEEASPAPPSHKIGGVLVESSSSGQSDLIDRIIIGIGVNLGVAPQDLPTDVDPPAGTLLGRFGDDVSDTVRVGPDDLLEAVLDRLEDALEALGEDVDATVEEAIGRAEARLAYRGTHVTFETMDGNTDDGIVLGLAASGALRITGPVATDTARANGTAGGAPAGERTLEPWDIRRLRPAPTDADHGSEPLEEPS